MRVKELADLTGTTVRAIRYYHQIGLLPVPAQAHPYRDYDLVHVARLTRIRWLTQAGVPLTTIAGLLGHAPSVSADDDARERILADLSATLEVLDTHLVELTAQRERMSTLADSVAAGGPLSPMPPAVARFYDEMERRCDDETTRQTIRRERDFNELAYFRGEMPLEAQLVFEGLDDASYAESMAAFTHLAEHDGAEAVPEEVIAQVATAAVDRIARRAGPDRARIARSMDLDMARRAAELYLKTTPSASRRLDRAVSEAILAALETWSKE
jgi:DNA-binding transcriptional MerR regulator